MSPWRKRRVMRDSRAILEAPPVDPVGPVVDDLAAFMAMDPEPGDEGTTLILLVEWLTTWADDLNALGRRQTDPYMRAFYHGLITGLRDVAWEIRNGTLEPGGDRYMAMVHGVPMGAHLPDREGQIGG